MAKTALADISDEALTSGTADSDRYVYSNYFVPLLITFDDDVTPIVPFTIKNDLLEMTRYGLVPEDRMKAIFEDLGVEELWDQNDMSEAVERLGPSALELGGNGLEPYRERTEETERPELSVREDGDGDDGEPVVTRGRAREDSVEAIADEIRETDTLLEALEPRLDAAGRELLTVASERLARSASELLERNGHGNGRSAAAAGLAIAERKAAVRPSVLTEEDAELIAGLLQSTIGYAFLDRTRISPVGFAIGEHVYALSLAPGEEAVLEQKTFTKRMATLEEQTEQEQQFDLELSSTYSTELQEGFERQRSLSDTWGFNISHTGSYQSPMTTYGQFNASHTIGYTKNVTAAAQETSRRSVKDGQTASSKVSARYRTQHKTLFRVATEEGFEAAAKRTITNPNRVTPVTLHYFKVLQRLRMRQERYGLRLCWAPSVKDPARTFFDKIRKGRERIIADAKAKIPPEPVEPKPSNPGGGATSTSRETKVATSPIKVADQWGWTGDMRADYDIDIPIPDGFEWDGDREFVESNIEIITRRPQEGVGRNLVGTPYPVQEEAASKLRVTVHIGAPSWIGGPGISIQVKARFYREVTVTDKSGEDTKYNDDLAAYRTALKEWADDRDEAIAAAQTAADEFEARMLADLSPVSEMVSQIIEQHFSPGVRDEAWEIEYWQRLFDWERASFVAYPSWWSSGDTRDPSRDPSDFLNASWAKLYLPVRVGMEKLALRWIHGKSVAVPMASSVEARFDEIVDDLRKFRADVLGAVDEVVELDAPCKEAPEKFVCMASWTEVMPTDGTHLEVVQGITSAADDTTKSEIESAEELREALLESEKRSAKLKDTAIDQMTEPATIDVRVGADGGHESET